MEIFLFVLLGGFVICVTFCWILCSNIRKENRYLQEQYEASEKERKKVMVKASQIWEENKRLESYKKIADVLQKQYEASEKKRKFVVAEASRIWEENKRLEPYKKIADVEDYTNHLLETTKLEADSIREEAKNIRSQVIIESHNIRRDAEAYAKSRRQEADLEEKSIKDNLNDIRIKAKLEADSIRQHIKRQTEEIIATTRAETQKKVTLLNSQVKYLTKTANALKRNVKGYGTEYMVPGISLLDDLALDYGYTEAGKMLKEKRNLVRSMFRENKAAVCEYVRRDRKEVAIAFVADTFNDKVEVILGRVRHDNYGKLAQRIQDAAILVNKNGRGFRMAQITSQYIEAQLDVLKWATIVHELKRKEKEEQKALKEQMREEVKVQQEIRRAQKEAAKEADEAAKAEQAAQKLYEEFKARFDAMSGREKILNAKRLESLEEKLAEAEERIRLAEEKKQRVLSMAQQTKQGHVYIISNVGSFGENVYKIGLTRRLEPEERIRELSGPSVPFPFDIHGMIHFDDAPAAETLLHRLFVMGQVNKTNNRKEFFRADLKTIQAAVEKLGGIATWTMVAEADQYRQTLRIEERIKKDQEYRQEWEARQIRLEQEDRFFLDDEEEEAK